MDPSPTALMHGFKSGSILGQGYHGLSFFFLAGFFLVAHCPQLLDDCELYLSVWSSHLKKNPTKERISSRSF